MRALYSIIFFLCFYCSLSAQSKIASKHPKVIDTASVNKLTREARKLVLTGQYAPALILVAKADGLARKNAYKAGLATCFNLRGIISYRQGHYLEAIDLLNTGLMLSKMANDSVIQSTAINNLGNAYAYMGDHAKAMKYYFMGLAIEEKIKTQNNLHWYYSNLANLYSEQNNLEKAFEYAFKAVRVERKINAKGALAVTLSNIAGMFQSQQKADSASLYYNEALPLAREMKDTFAIALILSNSALVYTQLKQYQTAYNKSMQSLEITKLKNYQDLSVYGYQNLGDIDLVYKRYESAEKNYLQALNIAKKIKSKLRVKDMLLSMAKLYEQMTNYKKASEYYKLFSDAKDSLFNEQNSKSMAEMNTKYTTEKKEQEIELLKKNEDIQTLELARQKDELSTQRTVSISIFVGFLLLMIVAILFYSQFRQKKRANDLLQHAYDLIEEKNSVIEKNNQMITDSITYAKRIQDTILPSDDELTKLFNDNFFVVYKPSQIVSGDFYWCSYQDNKIILAVADCTGHGVPGAFMSMIGNTLLNEIVNERKITCTQKIAELLNEKITHSLHQHEGSQKYDGIDISICSIDRVKKEILYTGANHFMYTFGEQLQKIKGNSFSIGGAQQRDDKEFTAQQIPYKSGLTLYFLTDGYCDQSSEETKKRFSSKQFESMLTEIQDQDMKNQKEVLEQAFERWKGASKQRDDVLVVGIKC
ncbi:MAG TPA: tetratricopeptide repeat protein [Bacteroidia bacterium]|nr:tetratricopeptide repeat protein [Bacteroidia bacterium]